METDLKFARDTLPSELTLQRNLDPALLETDAEKVHKTTTDF